MICKSSLKWAVEEIYVYTPFDIVIDIFLLLVKGLECFYCDSAECSDDHPGEIVKCQQQDPNGDHYGHTCAVGYSSMYTLIKIEQTRKIIILIYYNILSYVIILIRGNFLVGETFQWGRDCYTPPDGFVGCRQETRHEKPVQVCYCEGDLCNAKMDDISTSTTTEKLTSSSTNGKNTHNKL